MSQSIDRAIETKSPERRDPTSLKILLTRVAKMIRPLVVQMVMANFAASGIGTRSNRHYKSTGKMAASLADTMVFLNMRGGALRVRIGQPIGIGSYENQKGRANGFYKAFAALNYGAVHGGTATDKTSGQKLSILGVRSKKTIKKMMAGQEINSGGSRQALTGRNVAEARAERKLAAVQSLTGRKVESMVRPAYNFFQLKPAQLAQINAVAVNLIRIEDQKLRTQKGVSHAR